jgi:hypothetical protein
MSDDFKQAELGSNIFINTDILINYENKNGKFVNLFELNKNDLDFLLNTGDLRDEDGKYLGKLYKNKIIQGKSKSLTSGRKYETKRIPNKFWLKHGDKLLLCVSAEEPGKWVITGVFHIKVGEKEKLVRIEITDTEATVFERIKSEDQITKEMNVDFVKCGEFSNNSIIGMGGIKISGYKDDKGEEKDEGLGITFGFHK